MPEILDLDSLLAQMVLVLGVVLLAGNAYALFMDHRGVESKEEEGEIRRPRAWFLLALGALISCWGLFSLIA